MKSKFSKKFDENIFSLSLINTKGSKGTNVYNAPIWTRRPYILWGYRNKLSFIECILSVFKIHNEFGNIWIHFIGFFIFITLFIKDLAFHVNVPYYTLFTSIYNMSCIFMLGSSAFFHIITPYDPLTYERALRVDISGVTSIIISTYLVGIRYCFWCNSDIAKIYYIFVSILSIFAIGFSLIPSLIKNFKVSVCFFASFTLLSIIPIIHWFIIIGGSESEQASVFLWKYSNAFIIYSTGFFFFFTGYPERMFPGRLDLIGHSHQIWHIMVLLGSLQYYIAIKSYAIYWSSHTCIT